MIDLLKPLNDEVISEYAGKKVLQGYKDIPVREYYLDLINQLNDRIKLLNEILRDITDITIEQIK